MKTFSLLLVALSLSLGVYSQNRIKQHEIGLVFNNLDNFGISYKTGKNDRLWRFNTLMLSGQNSIETGDSISNSMNRHGAKIAFGKEYRKSISDNFKLSVGADLSFNYQHFERRDNNSSLTPHKVTTFAPGINLVFGLQYHLNDHLAFGAELLPYLNYSTSTIERHDDVTNQAIDTNIYGLQYGINNTSVLLSVVYKI